MQLLFTGHRFDTETGPQGEVEHDERLRVAPHVVAIPAKTVTAMREGCTVLRAEEVCVQVQRIGCRRSVNVWRVAHTPPPHFPGPSSYVLRDVMGKGHGVPFRMWNEEHPTKGIVQRDGVPACLAF